MVVLTTTLVVIMVVPGFGAGITILTSIHIWRLDRRLEEGYSMGKLEKVKETSRKILHLIKQFPHRDVAIKGGAEIDLIPKPVIRFFIEVKTLRSLMKKEQGEQDAGRAEGDKRLYSDDESVSKRDSS